MSALAEFFKGSEKTFGVFYPNHHLVAVFRDIHAAGTAGEKVLEAGVPREDVIVAAGKDVLEFDRDETGLAALLMKSLSRFFKTEQAYTDHDLDHAKAGAGFVVVRCETAAAKQDAWAMIAPLEPLDARYYDAHGIEHLAGDADTD